MQQEKNKAHLVYMTGISVNKKRLNNIVETINSDRDFTYWRRKSTSDLEKSFNVWPKLLGKVEQFTYRTIDNNIENSISLVELISSLTSYKIEDEILSNITDSEANRLLTDIRDKVSNFPKSIISNIFTGLGHYNQNEIVTDNEKKLFSDLLESYKYKLPQLTNGDFFSLYLSNQSDSIGLIPLAQLSKEKNFNFVNSYCDWDFYDNQYIDSVILKVNLNKYESKIDDKYIKKLFEVHIRETIFSYLELQKINDKEEDKEDKEEQDKKEKKSKEEKINNSLIANLIGTARYNKKSILQMLGERNFFGVALLSRILFELEDNKKNKTDKFNIKISKEQQDEKDFLYLRELLEYSTNPKTVNFTQENKTYDVEAKIYISDGKKLGKDKKILIQDEFLKSIYNVAENDWQGFVKKTVKNISLNYSEQDAIYINYVTKKDNNLYIKIPIKMMLSLPLDVLDNQQQKPNQELYIPKCIDNEKSKYIDILCVGGAEHNRALAHLINKYRFEQKENRLYGFMDNYYDMMHKMQKEKKNDDIEYNYSFFMGLNQPVSGWNYVLSARMDDKKGNSINSDIKLVTFKVHDNDDRVYNIVSIYGFSAIASVLGVNLFISELSQKSDDDFSKGIFSKNFSNYFHQLKIEESRGTASAIYFKSNPKDRVLEKFNNKCYQYAYQYTNKDYKNYLKSNNSELLKDIIQGKVINPNEDRTI